MQGSEDAVSTPRVKTPVDYESTDYESHSASCTIAAVVTHGHQASIEGGTAQDDQRRMDRAITER